MSLLDITQLDFMKRDQAVLGKAAILLLPPWSPLIAPLGISTVAEIFRENGIDCKEFDWNIELCTELEIQYGEAFKRESALFWDSVHVSSFWQEPDFYKQKHGEEISNWIKERLNILFSEGYTTFGFSVFESNTNVSRYVIQMLRQLQPTAFILMGGPATNIIIEYKSTDEWLADIDVIFYKEVEETLPAFIKTCQKAAKPVQTPGTAFVKPQPLASLQYYKRTLKKWLGYEVPHNYCSIFSPYDQITNLASIPAINFKNLDLKKYKSTYIPIEFSRGCVGACSFCSETIRYRPYRFRPVDLLIKDIKTVVDTYRTDTIYFVCSTLSGNRQHLAEFCRALISENIKVKWSGNARLDRTLDAELLKLMSLAGCHGLTFGLESGSDHVLGLMKKHSDVKTASEIIKMCSELDITIGINLIVGFPGETEKDLEETIDFINEHYRMVSTFNVSKCGVEGQSSLGKNPVKFGILTDDNRVVSVDPDHSKTDSLPAIIPNGPEWSDWCTVNGDNTPYIRNQRYQKVLESIDRFGKRGNTPQDSRNSNDLTA